MSRRTGPAVTVSGGGGSSSGLTSPVGAADGGTGRTTLTSGSYLKGNGTGTVNLQAAPIPVTDGGTGAITLTGVVYGAGTSALAAATFHQLRDRVIGTTASSATPTPNADAHDQYNVTALAAAALLTNPTGTPTDGQRLVWRIKDNGTARALTYDTQFRAVGVTLPTSTVISKTLYLGTIWNAADSKWDVVAVSQEA